MVVAHSSLAQPPQPALTKRKNRRKLKTKPGATPQAPQAPSSRTRPVDEELADITDTLSQPIDTSSLFAPPNPSTNDNADDGDELMIDVSTSTLSAPTAAPVFPPAVPSKSKALLAPETRRIPIPPHRMTPLKKDWINIFGPVTEILGLQVRMNVQRRCVEIRVCIFRHHPPHLELEINQTSKFTKDIGAIQKGADFVKAYALGFDVNVRRPASVLALC
jgi:RNA-binding protein PNO1